MSKAYANERSASRIATGILVGEPSNLRLEAGSLYSSLRRGRLASRRLLGLRTDKS